jgi:hypothetical protein
MKPYLSALAVAVCLGAGVSLVAGGDVALAQADITNAGKNIGDTASSWAGSLFAGFTAVAACFYGLQRKVGRRSCSPHWRCWSVGSSSHPRWCRTRLSRCGRPSCPNARCPTCRRPRARARW